MLLLISATFFLLCQFISASPPPVTSLFVPVEYVLNRFSASIAGNDATAATFVFDCGTDCGPVTVIQGPGTAIFSEKDQPITTVRDCQLYGTTSASCLLTSTSPGYSFPGTVTNTYPVATGFIFPLYPVAITAGAITGAFATSQPTGAASTTSSSSSATATTATQSITSTATAVTTSSAAVQSSGNSTAVATSTKVSSAWSGPSNVPKWHLFTLFQATLCLASFF